MTFPRLYPWPFANELRLVATGMLLVMTSLLFDDLMGEAFMHAAILVTALAGFRIVKVWRRLEEMQTE